MKAKFTIGGIAAIAGLLLCITGHIGLYLLGGALVFGGVYLMDGFKEEKA